MRWFCFAALAMATAGAAGQEIYRSFDPAGNVIYSDRPQGADAEPVLVLAGPRRSVPAASPAPVLAADPGLTANDEPLVAEMDAEPPPDELRELRARNCEIATERQLTYLNARRLFRSLADGEREYLTSEEIDEARARAAADVANWCD